MWVPFNRELYRTLKGTESPPIDQLFVAKRALNDITGQFVPLLSENQQTIEMAEDCIRVLGITELDGECRFSDEHKILSPTSVVWLKNKLVLS